MGWACSTNGAKMNSYRILVGKPEGKRPLGGGWTILKWTLDRQDGCMDWIDLAQNIDQGRNLETACNTVASASASSHSGFYSTGVSQSVESVSQWSESAVE
jgi:hypothetical protein